jgi:hypothetical protein
MIDYKIPYNNGIPSYWQDETSGQIKKAVDAYWQARIITGKNDELSPENIAILRIYLLHWAEAPCYRDNEHATATDLVQLDKAIAKAQNIKNIKDISNTLDFLMQLGIDPF